MPKINTTENKKSNIRRSCRNLYLIFCNQKFAENFFSYNATVRPILLVKNIKGHWVLLLFIFPCLHGYTNVNNLPLNMTRYQSKPLNIGMHRNCKNKGIIEIKAGEWLYGDSTGMCCR